ncbi:MAG TPA: Holliday junction resolvase RuvX [Campylobacterales bacterium]|nr:Holliday junction resolvase RuvX [Campylobacterales bacterium]
MTIASIDVGLKRIGRAICLDRSIVFPKDAILRKNRNQAANDVSKFLNEWNIDLLVVGLPKGGDSEDEMKRRIEHFISLLEFKKEIVYVDEYGSTQEAKESTKGIFKHKKDGKIDSIAAKIILERYLEI